MIVNVKNLQKLPTNISYIKKIVSTIASSTNTQNFDVGIWLVDNKVTHELNITMRDKDKPADVLSIPLHPDNPPGEIPPEEGGVLDLGEVYVSLEYIENQVKKGEVENFDTHLKKVLVHSYCHLLGYDHETDEDWELMLKEEARLFDVVKDIKYEKE